MQAMGQPDLTPAERSPKSTLPLYSKVLRHELSCPQAVWNPPVAMSVELAALAAELPGWVVTKPSEAVASKSPPDEDEQRRQQRVQPTAPSPSRLPGWLLLLPLLCSITAVVLVCTRQRKRRRHSNGVV